MNDIVVVKSWNQYKYVENFREHEELLDVFDSVESIDTFRTNISMVVVVVVVVVTVPAVNRKFVFFKFDFFSLLDSNTSKMPQRDDEIPGHFESCQG